MNEIARIIDQLEREHDGDPWHGPSLKSILEGVTWEQAAARPLPGAHSTWELVLHIAAWKNEVRHRLAGEPAGDPAEGDWPPVTTPGPDAWSAALAHLELAHRLLVSAIKDFPEAELYVPSNAPRHRALGTGVTYYELLHGLVQHDTYHAGQIRILRSVNR